MSGLTILLHHQKMAYSNKLLFLLKMPLWCAKIGTPFFIVFLEM